MLLLLMLEFNNWFSGSVRLYLPLLLVGESFVLDVNVV